MNHEVEEAPSTANSVVTAICIGLIVGFTGTMYHAYIWYISDGIYLPWGALLAILLTFLGTSWVSLRATKTWAGSLAGAVAFLLVLTFGFAKTGSVLVLANPVIPVGVAGTLWLLGTLFATVVSNVVVKKYQLRQRIKK